MIGALYPGLYAPSVAPTLVRVQGTGKVTGSGSTPTLTFSATPTAGNAIVIPITQWGGNEPPYATDNYGNAYSFAVRQTLGSNRVAILYCPKIVRTGASFTITVGTGSYHALAAIEVTGLGGGTLQIDQTASNTGSSSTPSTGTTAALTGSDVFSVACFSINNAQGSITADAGASPAWTQEYEELPFTNCTGEGVSRSRTSAAGTTESVSWTGTASAQWAAAVAVFKVAPATTLVPLGSVTVATGVSGGSTGAIDTTGATLIVLSVSYSVGASATYSGVSDSKGNTWTSLTPHTLGLVTHRFYYCLNPTVGSGHTFTVSGTAIYPALLVHAFTGATVSYVAENGATVSAGTSLAPGSVTPAVNGSLVITGLCAAQSNSWVVNADLAQTTVPYVFGNTYLGATGYLIQQTAAAINPTWSWFTAADAAASIAVFSPSTTAGRVSQDVIELLSLPYPDARTTQAVIELLATAAAFPSADVRVSHDAIELLSPAEPPTDARVSHDVLELLTAETGSRLTQFLVEILSEIPPPARISHLVTELLNLRLPPSPGRLTQTAVEALHSYDEIVPVRVSQVVVDAIHRYTSEMQVVRVSDDALETLHRYTSEMQPARLSQQVVEIVYPFGCYTPQPPPCEATADFPIDVFPAGGSCPSGILP